MDVLIMMIEDIVGPTYDRMTGALRIIIILLLITIQVAGHDDIVGLVTG